MCADPGVKFSFIAMAQKAASITPARERPWPVMAFVLLMAVFDPSPNTRFIALSSAASPMGVEVAWAFM